MRSWPAQKYIEADAVAGVIGGTESVLATVTAPTMQGVDGKILVEGSISFTAGTSGTAATIRIRRGNAITGTQVGTDYTVPCTSGVANNISMQTVDVPAAEYAGQQYSVCLLITGGTAAVTITAASVSATVS